MTAHRTRAASDAADATGRARGDGRPSGASPRQDATTADATAADAAAAEPLAHTIEDDDLLAGFRAGTLPPAALTHANHVRLGWLYLRAHPTLRAIEAFSADLVRYAAAIGAPGMYHETITWMYLLVIHERIQRGRVGGPTTTTTATTTAAPVRTGRADLGGGDDESDHGAETWDAFAAANPDLLVRGKDVLRRYYTDDALASDLARRTFVLPDRWR